MHASCRSRSIGSGAGGRAFVVAACLGALLPAQKSEQLPVRPLLRLELGGSPRGGLATETSPAGPVIERALQWLRRQQATDGRWPATDRDVATTGLVLLVLVREGVPAKDKVAIELMRGIKAMLDPHGIMNPGKVL